HTLSKGSLSATSNWKISWTPSASMIERTPISSANSTGNATCIPSLRTVSVRYFFRSPRILRVVTFSTVAGPCCGWTVIWPLENCTEESLPRGCVALRHDRERPVTVSLPAGPPGGGAVETRGNSQPHLVDAPDPREPTFLLSHNLDINASPC